MRRGAHNEDVALQPHPAQEFACKLFIQILLIFKIILDKMNTYLIKTKGEEEYVRKIISSERKQG